MQDKIEFVKTTLDSLFSMIGINSNYEVVDNKEAEMLEINIESGDETGLLIGRKGENLNSIQTFLGLAIKNKFDEWVRVSVNVGDYKEKEEEYLKHIADSAIAKVRETGEDFPIYNLKPAQRRFVHLYLSENKDVETQSEGEGRDRYLVVKKA